LTAIKADAKRYPKLDIAFSNTDPLAVPVIVNLPENGLRLRFDAPEQRLRLIEIVELDKDRFNVKNELLILPNDGLPARPALHYRRVYQLFGASYPGEYISSGDGSGQGLYVVSYPGIALSFPLAQSIFSPDIDHAKMLSSSASSVAAIAIFEGKSWPEARKDLFTRRSAFPRSLGTVFRHKEGMPDEIELVRVLEAGRLELVRRNASSVKITLHETTPQDLITDLGPPDAIYKRPTDMTEAPQRPNRTTRRRSSNAVPRGSYGSTPSSVSSTNTDTYDADFEEDDAIDGPDVIRAEDQYYCYYNHGFDVLLSSTTTSTPAASNASSSKSRVVRIVLHGNVPGSYPFNRHRRCQWIVEYVKTQHQPVTSESKFKDVHGRLLTAFKGVWPEKEMKEGMVLVRDWNGDSPSGSAVLIGEESDEEEEEPFDRNKEQWLKNTRLYKFPGLMMEVMHNGAISALTVY